MGATEDTGEEHVTTTESYPGTDALIGQVLDGRFKIVAPIGVGGMGRVYKAVQAPLNRAVAVKVLDYNYGPGRDRTFRQRFLVEAALTAKLNHPNTVTVIDYGCTAEGIFYIAMEYLEGETLEQVLSTSGALPWRRVLAIGQQLARSLREAHDLGVVHRDLKPGNIMLLEADDDTDVVKVLDFGLVKSFVEGHELEGRALTQQGMLMGSPPYMAPEQGENNVADPRCDIYSLGIILYECLTGSPPFTGSNAMTVILNHIHKPVPPLAAPAGMERPPPRFVALVMRCLEKSAMDRFQSMQEVLAAIQEVTAEERSATPSRGTRAPAPESKVSPSQKPARTRGSTLALCALAAGLGSAATVALLPRLIQPTPLPPIVIVAPPAPPAAPQPTPTTFHLDSEPRGARVLEGGEPLGVTPLTLERMPGADGSATAAVTLQLEGYLDASLTLRGSGPTLEVLHTLTADEPAVPVPPPAPPAKKKKSESPKRAR